VSTILPNALPSAAAACAAAPSLRGTTSSMIALASWEEQAHDVVELFSGLAIVEPMIAPASEHERE